MTFAVAVVLFEPQPRLVHQLKELFQIIPNAHDDQGDNPGQVTGLNGVLYKL